MTKNYTVSGAIRTSCLPKFLPFSRPIKAAGAVFRPSAISSLYFSLPELIQRSDERRVGKECVRTCRSRGSLSHYNKKKLKKVICKSPSYTILTKDSL